MEQHDDYDIIQEEDEGTSHTWIWIAIVAIVALFAFGVGAAVILVSNRLTSPADTPPTPPPTQIAISGTAQVTATPTISVTITPTQTVTPTPTATLSPTATPTVEVVCTEPVNEQLASLYDKSLFGCALGGAQTVWGAWQPFERGAMLWRSDTDRSYVFYEDGSWFPVEERWDGAPPANRGNPPPGLQAPIRGFGYVWSRSDEIFSRLGWASDQERGFCALVQDFDSGFLLNSSTVPSCTEEGLFNQATAPDWREVRLAAPDERRVDRGAQTVLPTPPPQQPSGDNVRPAGQGSFPATRLNGLVLDASFSEWPGNWQPIQTVVFGSDRHDGPGDLSASFQTGWLEDGLALAVRVNDDQFRPGPDGTTMWQGDGLEIHFDRQLAADFSSSQASDDDYQIGIAPRENYNGLRSYHWLPFSKESSLTLPHAVIGTDQGYELEVLIPWHIFDLDTVEAGQLFGFNLSVSDNDSDEPDQETVASASPARTTHDDPTEWGTLRLMP